MTPEQIREGKGMSEFATRLQLAVKEISAALEAKDAEIERLVRHNGELADLGLRQQSEIERLRGKLEIAGAHPFPKDFDALDLAVERNKALTAENAKLQAVVYALRYCGEGNE